MDVFSLVAKLTLDSSEYDKGLDTAKKGADDFGKTWDSAKSSMAKGTKSIAAGAGVLAGLGTAAFKAADSLSKNLDEIDKTSQKVGMSTKAYQEWDYVLKISGTEMSNMTTGLKTLTNKFDDAVNGSESAVDTFKRLGISMEDIQDLSREDLFGKVITAFQGMEDSAERAALANDLFGKSGQDLTPLFNTTAEETARLIEQVNSLGGVMSEDAVANGAAFQDSLTSLKTAMSGASGQLLEKLVPAITALMDKVSQFVASGGMDKLINTFQTLAPVIGVVVAAFAGFKIISGLATIIQGVSTAFGILNAVMMANPIGLVIAGIAALVAAFVTLWNKSEEFRNFWIGIWESISKFATEAWDKIKNAFSEIGSWFKEKFQAAKEGAVNAWSNIKEKFSEKWENIKAAFADPAGWFKEKFEAAKEAVINAWSNIKEKAAEIWEKLKSGFTLEDALSWGKDMIQNFINGIKQKWEDLKATVSGIGQMIKDFIGFSEPKEGPLSNFHTFAPDMMKLFAEGIADNEDIVKDQIAKSFDFGEATINPSISGGTGGGYMGGGSQNITIEFTGDLAGLAQVLHPYIKGENARIGTAMVV